MQNVPLHSAEWKQLVERLPVAVYIAEVNFNSTTLYVSPRLEQMLGFSASDYESHPDLWLDQVHVEDRERVLSDLARCHETSGTLDTGYRMETGEGKTIWVSDKAEVVRDETSGAVYLLGALVDVSERKDFQDRLEQSEAKYRLLVENTSDLVVKVDPDGRFSFVSRSYCQLFGKSEEELLGAKFMPLVHEDDRQATEEAMQTLYQSPYTAYVEQRALTGLGWRWLAWKYNAILDANGTVTAIIGIGRDITQNKGVDAELQQSQRQLRETLAYERLGSWELFPGSRAANWSREIYDIFGIDASVIAGPKTLEKLLHPEDRTAVIRSLESSLSKGIEHHVDYRIQRPDGEGRWVECRAKPVVGEQGRIEKLAGFMQDITTRKKTEEALRRSEERFRSVATATNDVIYEWNTADDVLLWYGDIDRALGYAPGAFPRTIDAWINAIHPDDRAPVEAEVERVKTEGGKVDITYRIAAANGAWRIWRDIGVTVRPLDGHAVTLIGGCTDVTEQKNAEAKIQHLAFHDSLTGLPNRLMLKEELQQALESFRRNKEQFALHYLDLDQFKDINDSLGHQVGDELLCAVVKRIKTITRGVDFFSRLGGDEFALIQSKVGDAAQASFLASKVIKQIGKEFELTDKTVLINTSIGIVVPEDDAISVDELLKRADAALYKAKEAGRGTYAFFHDSMTIALQREIELVHYLSSAIKRGEFYLDYQPQYDLLNKRLVGLEALIRWNHPNRGLLMPGDFLQIAEKRGLIREISDWALSTACRQAREWREEFDYSGRIAVNLCAMQVNSEDFYQKIVDILDRTGAIPDLLELEFTETVLMEATDRTKSAIQRLSELGIQFAIDDFGTGFSSLSYLKNFHADKIKIDREFIRGLEEDPSDAEIVKAAIALGNALGLRTVAEGVETPEQEAFLTEHGCHEAQGYYYSRPLHVADVEASLNA